MSAVRVRIVGLDRSRDRSGFDCGEEVLDRYFRERIGQDVARSLTAAFVAEDVEHGGIAGFYTLSALSLQAAELPAELAKKLPRYPIPAMLLGRLAVDRRYRGQGLGTALLFDALTRAYRARTTVGAIAVVVDAKHEKARSFYERHEFRRLPEQPFRLFLLMAEIGRLIEED